MFVAGGGRFESRHVKFKNIFILFFESKGWWLVNQKKLQLIVIPPLLETWIAPKYQNLLQIDA